MEISKLSLSELETKKLNQQIYEKRLKSAQELAKIKDSLVIDKVNGFYGVLSVDKKNPKDKKYYAVNVNNDNPQDLKYFCDCVDYSQCIKHNKRHMCKHCLRLKIGIDNKEKIKIVDLTNLLKKESL